VEIKPIAVLVYFSFYSQLKMSFKFSGRGCNE
jgi:hypothetical protein